MMRRTLQLLRWRVCMSFLLGQLYVIWNFFNLIVKRPFYMPKSVIPYMPVHSPTTLPLLLPKFSVFWLLFMVCASRLMSFICSSFPFFLLSVWFVARLTMGYSWVNGHLHPTLRSLCQLMVVPLFYMSRYTLMMALLSPIPPLSMPGFYPLSRSVFRSWIWAPVRSFSTSLFFKIGLTGRFGFLPMFILQSYLMSGTWRPVVRHPPLSRLISRICPWLLLRQSLPFPTPILCPSTSAWLVVCYTWL